MDNYFLKTKNISVTYKKGAQSFNAITAVSFTAQKGNIIGIIGESGSGKSSLLKTILHKGISDKTISIGGDVIFPPHHTSTGIILQNPLTSLCPVLNVENHFYDVLHLTNKKQRQRIVLEWLKNVKIKSPSLYLKKYPHELSGGEQQRINIALSLCTYPKILLADEPTASLDPSIRQEILLLLQELKQKFNLEVIYVSHNLGVIYYIADYILVMNNGQIVEQGYKDNIFKTPQNDYTKTLIKSYKT